MSLKKQVLLFLTNKTIDSVLNAYSRIHYAIQNSIHTCILYHQHPDEEAVPCRLAAYDCYNFSYESLQALDYIAVAAQLVPGSNHFPLLQFYLAHPYYNYYWLIEDDVAFSGSWKYFFDAFKESDEDLITSHIRLFDEEPRWPWWRTFYHPQKEIAVNKRLRAFNPVYRISRQALAYIHHVLQNGSFGHHEVLLPTLLYHTGFKLLDFGGHGTFTPQQNRNRFYTSADSEAGSLAAGTMRYRPYWHSTGKDINKLYHPVKPWENIITPPF